MSDPLLTENEAPVQTKAEKTGVGPMVSTFVVVILIVLGGIYFFVSKIHTL